MNVVSMTKTIHLLAKKKTTLEIISFSMTMKDQEIFNNSAASFRSNRSQREYLDENHDQRYYPTHSTCNVKSLTPASCNL